MSTIEIYKDEAGEFRWTLKAKNGEPVADSGEGYVSRQGVNKAVTRFRRMLKVSIKVKDLTKIPTVDIVPPVVDEATTPEPIPTPVAEEPVPA